jgi:glucose-1-phosphate adenylyltransferase
MDHVGSGKDWDLARKDGGVIFLPPFGDFGNDTLYNSRLEALKGITNFLFRADEEYVVMTDCDTVCRIDYNDVIETHMRNHADITLVYKKLNKNELPENTPITEFAIEKGRITSVSKDVLPEKEQMNVFINMFIMKKSLLQNIVMDSVSHNRKHFMTDVISDNLKSMKVYGYEHKGFYTGITSLRAYYESNMSMLNPECRHELFGDRSVFTKIRDSAPTKYGSCSSVVNSFFLP